MHTVYTESVYYLKAQNSPEEARLLKTSYKVHRHSILNVFFRKMRKPWSYLKEARLKMDTALYFKLLQSRVQTCFKPSNSFFDLHTLSKDNSAEREVLFREWVPWDPFQILLLKSTQRIEYRNNTISRWQTHEAQTSFDSMSRKCHLVTSCTRN